MNQKVFVTGTGIVSAIGHNNDTVLASLRASKHGIAPIGHPETIHKGVFPVGAVRFSNDELARMAGLKSSRHYTRTALLGILAASESMQNARWKTSAGKTGLFSATSVGGMDRTEFFYPLYQQGVYPGSLQNIAGHDCGDSTEKIAVHLGVRDFVTTISTACSSSVNSIMFAARLISMGYLDAAVAGGTDAITRFTLNGFNTLMILDKQHCRPFDDTRAGLNLGEGAAYLFLESEASVMKRGVQPVCRIGGYGNANDAFHQTASSPDGQGAWLAMSAALGKAGIQPSDIGYINVHGTGTQNNDLSEGIAIKRLFGDTLPPFSSTKPFTGHTLGAAGAIEAVFSAFSLKYGMIYPNLNFSTPMNETGMIPNTAFREGIKITHVLSNSFGFGGNNSSVILSSSES